MAKSYEEQIKELQEKIAKKKEEQRNERKKFEAKIGRALTTRFPELLDMYYEDGFNIFEYVETKEFANKVYSAWKKDKEAAASATAGTYNEQNGQIESYQ